MAALADILLFRFVIRVSLLETAGWIAFVFLQAPRQPTPAPAFIYTSHASLARGVIAGLAALSACTRLAKHAADGWSGMLEEGRVCARRSTRSSS